MNMNWQDILAIVVPLCALLGWIYKRIDGKFDKIEKRFDTKFECLCSELKEIKTEVKETRKDIQGLDSRISRIEGQLMPSHYWEPKVGGQGS